ncbi:GntR family transcriptional regulator [Streptomyces yaanensis]|uniref:GntR family transcriptional regulator n=1 Tax=Streptomyces yaanensis TaxID=1142239 RepID=A0ABV7SD75_9ACTN|nr:GntR family transcriptional regulator [Streptomyces sp. CGMCC 4.7035]WNB98605.1 GntR family transcriptional regulator [Streptomyces sp. CGMCC 4.7035]
MNDPRLPSAARTEEEPVEQARSRSAEGSAETGVPDVPGAAVRVPEQLRAGDAVRERGAAEGSTRGEHTHSEPPIPRPRAAGHGGESATGEGPHDGEPSHVEGGRPVIQRASVRRQILDALRTALVAGELTPGEVYSAPALGDRFGVSATPVREAMQQLALEGAVEVVPNRGFRVAVRGARELAELAEIRALIEVPVMLRLARTVPAERWSELRPLAEATVRAASSGCRATYAESDRAFHHAVLALAGNEQLVRIAEDLHRRAQWPLVGGPVSRGRADLIADAAEHTALLDALAAQDLAVVQSLVREHFAGAS